MANDSRIRLLTFDLDDTLWEFAPVLWRAEQITYAWLQQHAPQVSARFSLEAMREMRLQIARDQPELAHRVSALRMLGLQRAMRLADIAEDAIDALAQAAFDIFLEARHRIELFDAAEEVLDELSREYTLAAITNGNVDVKKIGLNRYFALAVNAEKLARAKPHPEPFIAALEQSGCTPAQCIHIGDDIENDIRGAQRLGIHTIWMNVTGSIWPLDQPPSGQIQQLLDLPAAVRAIAQNPSEPVHIR